MRKECPFCEIDPQVTNVIEESSLYQVILSNPRVVPGHLLVMPKRYILTPWEMTEKERRIVLDTLLKYQAKIIKEFVAPGCDVRQNYRPFVPQGKVKVDHTHYHLLPRFSEDEFDKKVGVLERTLWTKLSPTERAKFKALYTIY